MSEKGYRSKERGGSRREIKGVEAGRGKLPLESSDKALSERTYLF